MVDQIADVRGHDLTKLIYEVIIHIKIKGPNTNLFLLDLSRFFEISRAFFSFFNYDEAGRLLMFWLGLRRFPQASAHFTSRHHRYYEFGNRFEAPRDRMAHSYHSHQFRFTRGDECVTIPSW